MERNVQGERESGWGRYFKVGRMRLCRAVNNVNIPAARHLRNVPGLTCRIFYFFKMEYVSERFSSVVHYGFVDKYAEDLFTDPFFNSSKLRYQSAIRNVGRSLR